MLRTIIIDDEQAGREVLRLMLERYCPDVDLVMMASSPEEGRQGIVVHHPELIFLDIEMPRQNGFVFLEQFPVRAFDVIFVSAHRGYIADAVRFAPVDFLLKPYDGRALRAAVDKAASRQSRNICS